MSRIYIEKRKETTLFIFLVGGKRRRKSRRDVFVFIIIFSLVSFCMAKNNKNNYQLRSRTCMRMVCVCVFLSALVYLFILWSQLESVSLSERLASCVCVYLFFVCLISLRVM